MPLNVIVIDDSPLQLLLVARLIEKNPELTLLGAYANPLLGLVAVNSAAVDLVLLDVEMPEMDGFEFKAQLEKEVSVVMNSTKAIFQEQACKAGAFDFLQKPISAADLKATVSKMATLKKYLVPETKSITSIAS